MKPLLGQSVDPSPAREEELVARAQAGNRDAFEALFRNYRGAITAYVRASVRDEGRAEDIVQEIFLSAHNSLATLSHPRAFRSWLYQIAHNACLDDARRRSRNDELILGWDEFPPPDERIVVHHQGPDHQLSQKEELAHLTHALDGLPPSQHEALVLRELEGMSYDEIGRRMQLSPGAVESVLFRARRGLKRAYSKAAAFLPLPAFLRRAGSGGEASSSGSAFAAQLTTVGPDNAVSLAHKAAAVVAAIAVVGGGTAAIETTGVLDSDSAKNEVAKPQVTVSPASRHDRAAAHGGSARPVRTEQPKTAAGGGGSSPALAPPTSSAPSPAVGGPGAPATTAPAPAAPAPGTSSPANSGPPPSSGSNAPQSTQPTSTQGAKVPKKKSQQLTTPTGQPIPTQLPPGIQRQLESGKRTLDNIPSGLQKKLADGSTSSTTAAP